jgi:hypothetical protein
VPEASCERCGLDLGIDDDPQKNVCMMCLYTAGEWRAPHESNPWRAVGFSARSALSWRQEGFSVTEAEAWCAAGTGPGQASRWRRCDKDPSSVGWWLANGYSVETATEWCEWDLYEALSWTKQQFSFAEAERWKDWVDGPLSARRKVDAGLRLPAQDFLGFDLKLEDALAWERHGFVAEAGASCLEHYLAAGASVAQAIVLRVQFFAEYGVDSDDEGGTHSVELRVSPWMVRNFIDNRIELVRAGVRPSVEAADQWASLKASEILEAVDRGFPAADEYLTWSETATTWDAVLSVLDPYDPDDPDELLDDLVELYPYLVAGMSESEANSWRRHRFPAEEGQTWALAGLDAEQAATWRHFGLRSNEAAQWAGIGVTRAAVAALWHHAGWTPATAKPWMDKGFGADTAGAWSRAGASPEIAARRAAAGLQPPVI